MLLLQIFPHPYHLPFQIGDILCKHLPGHFNVHAEIFVDEDITHAGYLLPWNILISSLHLFRDVLDSLTDNLDAANYSILQLDRGEEVILGLASGIILNKPYTLEDMVYEYRRVFFHKIGTCSFNILSLKSGWSEP